MRGQIGLRSPIKVCVTLIIKAIRNLGEFLIGTKTQSDSSDNCLASIICRLLTLQQKQCTNKQKNGTYIDYPLRYTFILPPQHGLREQKSYQAEGYTLSAWLILPF
jgi:hypothetical protein